MKTIKTLLVGIVRLLAVWFVDTLSLLLTAWLIPGIDIQASGGYSMFTVAVAAALLMGIINFLVRPLLLLLTVPLGWIVVFLVGFFINAITLEITAGLMEGFTISSWWTAFFGAFVLSFINTILIELLNINNENSFYVNQLLRQAAKQREKIEDPNARGLMMVEIDGLSYYHFQEAIEKGYMPTMKKLIDEYGYEISRVDCGLPSTTPACQAGIMHGNNENIPAFRWLDKSTGKMMAGGQAAAIIEPILSDGQGLMRGGSSIGNMFSGDADKSILTFSKLLAGTPEDKKKRARDMYMLMRNPTFFIHVLVLFFGDVIVELWEGWQQRRKDVQPRVNRLHNGYPFIRAATNVFLRDVGIYLSILDIVRGVPSIYTLFAGYDEVAHHAGPQTKDAMRTLRQLDHTLEILLKVIQEKAPRPYELILLSDHGQSVGATFKQRYGVDILTYVKSLLPEGTNMAGSGGGDDGSTPVTAMLQELENVKAQNMGGAISRAAMSQTQKVLARNPDLQERTHVDQPADVTVCYSGNFAQVYFDLYPRKITLNELNAAYPGMVDALVQHEGIGFVVAYEDDGTPVVFGKQGARNLHTGDVVGEDPLLPFGDVELRAWQIRRVADFSNAGDLILNSTLYPDGTVAALEELVGSHGGIGGQQTDAFLFHPGDMQVPEIRNSQEVKAVLDARRGLPGSPLTPPEPEEPLPQTEAWSLGVLFGGLAKVGTWLGNAASAIALRPAAYRSIARDAYMTGPAVLIMLLAQALQTALSDGGFDPLHYLLRIIAWLLAIVLLAEAAHVLRGKGDFTSTLRVAGFAQGAHFLQLLAFVPVLGPAVDFVVVFLVVMGVWMGTVIAHDLKGWRTVVLPLIYILVVFVSVVFLVAAIEGTTFTIQMLLQSLGLL